MSDCIASSPKPMKFFYWTIADGEHSKMAQVLVDSARKSGVTEDFHIWSDRKIEGAINHECGDFDHAHYMFKIKFLKEEVSKIKGYDYCVFLDADNYFVRNPGNLDKYIANNDIFVQLESELTSELLVRKDWWGLEIKYFDLLFSKFVGSRERYWNCNAGLFMVRMSEIKVISEMIETVFNYCNKKLKLRDFTEEPPLAIAGHLVSFPERNTLRCTSNLWASDWTGIFANQLPFGEGWKFVDYMTDEKIPVNPAIVHCMRSDHLLIRKFNERNPNKGKLK